MNKPDFKQEALSYTRRQFVDYGDNTVEEQIATAYEAGCEHVWNTHVVPLQQSLDDEIKNNENLTIHCDGLDAMIRLYAKRELSHFKQHSDMNKDQVAQIDNLESENKLLREEIAQLKEQIEQMNYESRNDDAIRDLDV